MSRPLIGLVALAWLGCKGQARSGETTGAGAPGRGSGSAGPAASAAAPEPRADAACAGGRITLRRDGRESDLLELGCEDGIAQVRYRSDEYTAGKPVERKLSSDEWAAAWKAIDQAGWRTLPQDCGTFDETARADRAVHLEVAVEDTTRKFDCSQLGLPPGHEPLIRAVEALAARWQDAGAVPVTTTPESLRLTSTGALGFQLDGHVDDHPEFLDDRRDQASQLRLAPVLKKVGEHKVEVWVAMERQLVLSLDSAKLITAITVVGRMARTANGVGVGTAATEAKSKLGALTNVDTSTRGQACASFQEQGGADGFMELCFTTRAKDWPAIEAARATVSSIRLIAAGEGEGEE